MNIEDLRDRCLNVKHAEESTPFGEDVLVYKVMNKMFALIPLRPKNAEYFVALKCDPEKSRELREKYTGITKGFYAGESLLWNSVHIQNDVPDTLIIELIGHSADEVLKKLSKKKQAEYRALDTNE